MGGAENKENARRILERFVRESGGGEADIVVIPTASRLHETGARYEELFRNIGAGLVRSEEHTSELQSRLHLVCRLLLEKKKKNDTCREVTSNTRAHLLELVV